MVKIKRFVDIFNRTIVVDFIGKNSPKLIRFVFAKSFRTAFEIYDGRFGYIAHFFKRYIK